jgi:hypothetical protein
MSYQYRLLNQYTQNGGISGRGEGNFTVKFAYYHLFIALIYF